MKRIERLMDWAETTPGLGPTYAFVALVILTAWLLVALGTAALVIFGLILAAVLP